MLTTAQPVPEIVQHVYYVLANEACRHILKEIGMLEFLDNRIYINSTLHNPSKSWDQNLNPILVEDKFTCTFDIKHSSLSLTWDTTTTSQHMDSVSHRRDRLSSFPILMDKKHRIMLTETVLPFNLGMNCDISLRDYNLAHEVIDRFHLRFNKGEMVSLANLSYDYPLPFNIVKSLWALASTCGVDKKCFPIWLEQYSNGMIKRIVSNTLKGNHVEFVVKKEAFETLIKVDYDLNSDPDKEGVQQAETLGLQFTLTLHSTRPSVLYLDYPIIVNNTLVPPEIVNVDTSYQNELYKFLCYPRRYMNPEYQESKFLTYQPVRNPWYDDWTVPEYNTLHAALDTKPFFIGAFTLDEPSCDACPCACDPDGNPYEDHACLHHKWISERPADYKHDCNDCPYHKRTPYEVECPCWCVKKARTLINLDTDLDMYRLSKKVRNYYKERKEKCLNIEDIYNIAVFVDNVQLDKRLIEFDGTTVSVSNALGPDHIYRLVLSKTRPRHVDKSMADAQGDDPYHPLPTQYYKHPFLDVMDCIIAVQQEGANNGNV